MTRDQAKSREKLIAELTEMRRQIRTYRTHILEKIEDEEPCRDHAVCGSEQACRMKAIEMEGS
ncbi:MAG: hypothetical protein NTY16_03890 [Deltaproteobacteria bacterium]|nr:hypothetical protein [Deltaproteobacteria bacterium]